MPGFVAGNRQRIDGVIDWWHAVFDKKVFIWGHCGIYFHSKFVQTLAKRKGDVGEGAPHVVHSMLVFEMRGKIELNSRARESS